MGDEYQYGDPCTNCGHSGHMHETCEAHGVSHFDEDGRIQSFDNNQFGRTLVVQCPECGEYLINKLGGDNE